MRAGAVGPFDRIRWLEDDPLGEWDIYPTIDRMTNVRDGRLLIVGEVAIHQYNNPADSPLLKMLGVRSTTVTRKREPLRRRITYRWRAFRSRLAAWIDPYPPDDDWWD